MGTEPHELTDDDLNGIAEFMRKFSDDLLDVAHRMAELTPPKPMLDFLIEGVTALTDPQYDEDWSEDSRRRLLLSKHIAIALNSLRATIVQAAFDAMSPEAKEAYRNARTRNDG